MTLTGGFFLGMIAAVTVAAVVALLARWPALAGSRPGPLAARTALLLGVNALVLLTAATQLNAQFLFFADWTDLRNALGGTTSSTALQRGNAATAAAGRVTSGAAAKVATGPLPALPGGSDVLTFRVTGARSGLSGTVVVQLPPGYRDAGSSRTRYPVLETFHGYPGAPRQWIDTMGLGGAVSQAVAARRIRPVLIVSPQLEIPGGVDTECVNGQPGSPQLETWVTKDVPAWVANTFRVTADRASWATIGLSAGGWCAAMATMLNPAQYAAAIVMGGYFRPEFGPFYLPYAPRTALARRYDLVALARRAPPPVALWVETSHSDAVSYGSSAALLKAVRPPLAVDATVLQHAGHRISLWQGLLPASLSWLGSNVRGFAPPR